LSLTDDAILSVSVLLGVEVSSARSVSKPVASSDEPAGSS